MFFILPLVVVFLFHCFICTHSVYATLVSTGQTLLLNDLPYYVPAKAFTTLPLPYIKSLSFAGGFVPVTVVGLSSVNSSQGTLATVIDSFGSDDVWNAAFLEGKSNLGRKGDSLIAHSKSHSGELGAMVISIAFVTVHIKRDHCME